MKLFKRCVSVLSVLIIISCIITAVLVYQKDDTTKLTSNEKDKILALLSEHNVKITKDSLPKEYPALPCVNMRNAIHERTAFAASVLGNNFSVFDYNTYTAENSTLEFSGNSFAIYYSSPDFNITNENEAKALLQKLSFNSDEALIMQDHSTFTVYKTLNGFCVFDFSLKLKSSNNSEIVGVWFEPANNTFYKKQRPLISVISELLENPDLKGKTITAITPGYKIGELSEYKKEVVAYPVWRITIDDTLNYDFFM